MQKYWQVTNRVLYCEHPLWRCACTVGTFRFEAREDKDEIVVEIRELVKLLQFLQDLLRSSTVDTSAHTQLRHPPIPCVPVGAADESQSHWFT